MVDRTIKTPEMEVDCNDSYALHSQFEPPEEATYSSADTYSVKNEHCSSGSSVHDAKTSACHRDLAAEIVDSESFEFLSESGSFGLVSLFDESVTLEDATTRDTNRRQRSGRQNEKRKQVESSGQESTQDWQPKKRPKKTRPNYFVAWKVSNPEIHSAIKLVQDSIIAHSEILKPALIPLDTLHITLMVMHLEDSEQVEKAKSALKNCKTGICSILGNAVGEKMAECTEDKSVELQECCGEDSMPVYTPEESVPVALTFSGLDQFRHQVVFAKLGTEENMALLNSVASVVREEFDSEGIFSTDSREFQPHLTVMKLSRKPFLKKKGIKTIPAESYSAFQDTEFGRQTLTQLHLCSMTHPKENGFYKIFGTVELGDDAKNDVNTNDEGAGDENEPQA